MVDYDSQKNPIIKFRLKTELVKILNNIGKGFLSEDLIAKHLLIDHLIQRGLVPKYLIREICDDMALDFREIKKSHGLSNLEYDLFLKLVLEKIKNAQEKNN